MMSSARNLMSTNAVLLLATRVDIQIYDFARLVSSKKTTRLVEFFVQMRIGISKIQ